MCAVVAYSQVASSASNITLTEEDYFNTPGQIAALDLYSKQFEAAHPGVTIKRQYVPFANLNTKLLTQAAAQDLPNLLAVDNPFVSTMISTGQVVPLSKLKGFSAKGYFPAVINEGLSDHQYYSLPVAGANSIALIYNIAMFKAAHLTPPKTWAQLVSDAKALTTSDHYGIAHL
jgi:multiple sugar transport system substrate-binding protein